MHNFTYWLNNFFSLTMQGYETALGVLLWPLLFSGVIGYVYLKQQSYTAAAVAAMIIISVFGNYLLAVPGFMIFIYLFVSLTITALILVFISRRRGA